jgi:ATP-dependent RNA helicase HelY
MLSQILLLTETIRNGILDNLSAPELLSVVSSMIFQSRSREDYAPKMPHQNVANALAEITRLWAKLEEIENEFRCEDSEGTRFRFRLYLLNGHKAIRLPTC